MQINDFFLINKIKLLCLYSSDLCVFTVIHCYFWCSHLLLQKKRKERKKSAYREHCCVGVVVVVWVWTGVWVCGVVRWYVVGDGCMWVCGGVCGVWGVCCVVCVCGCVCVGCGVCVCGVWCGVCVVCVLSGCVVCVCDGCVVLCVCVCVCVCVCRECVCVCHFQSSCIKI